MSTHTTTSTDLYLTITLSGKVTFDRTGPDSGTYVEDVDVESATLEGSHTFPLTRKAKDAILAALGSEADDLLIEAAGDE